MLAVGANKSLVSQDTMFAPSGFHHLAGERLKVVELAGFDCQLDAPRNLIAHSRQFANSNTSVAFGVKRKSAGSQSPVTRSRMTLTGPDAATRRRLGICVVGG